MKNGFTHEPIKGVPAAHRLPAGTALVLEGGGMRGFYSAGVLDAFMDDSIMFPYIAAVSAGAANALSYISGQKGRNRQVVQHYVHSKKYLSKRNLLLHRSLFNMNYVFGEIPTKHLMFDWQVFLDTNVNFYTGCMNCADGKSIWFDKAHVKPPLSAVVASCSIPMVSKIVKYNGYELLDGGVSDPIPIEKSIADGNTFHVIVLTRNVGYRKPPEKHVAALKLLYRNHPGVVEGVLRRHTVYNRQLALCEQLEREGKAVIIRPKQPLKVERAANDTLQLLRLYDEGYVEGREKLAEIYKMTGFKL